MFLLSKSTVGLLITMQFRADCKLDLMTTWASPTVNTVTFQTDLIREPNKGGPLLRNHDFEGGGQASKRGPHA